MLCCDWSSRHPTPAAKNRYPHPRTWSTILAGSYRWLQLFTFMGLTSAVAKRICGLAELAETSST